MRLTSAPPLLFTSPASLPSPGGLSRWSARFLAQLGPGGQDGSFVPVRDLITCTGIQGPLGPGGRGRSEALFLCSVGRCV